MQKHNFIIRTFLYVTILLLIPSTGFTQEGSTKDSTNSIKISGYIDTYHAVGVNSPHKITLTRTRANGKIVKTLGKSSITFSALATYNPYVKEDNEIGLRNAYIEHAENHWGFRIGHQIVVWGIADGVRVTDLITPLDLVEFVAQDYDDLRRYVNAARFFVFNKSKTAQLEVIVVPKFKGSRFSTDLDNPWGIFNNLRNIPNMQIVWDDATYTPDLKVSNVEYGGRLTMNLPAVNFSLLALHTWNKIPVIEENYVTPTELHATTRYYRMGAFGGDVTVPAGQLVFKADAVFNTSKHFSYKAAATQPQKGFNTVHWLIGVDWHAPQDLKISAQFSAENILNYKDYIAQRRNFNLLTFSLSKKLSVKDKDLTLSNFTYFDIDGRGWFSRFYADYAFTPQINFTLGYDWVGSKRESIFTRYKNNSEAWVKLAYTF